MKMCCPQCQNYFEPKSFIIAKYICPFCGKEIRLYDYKIIKWIALGFALSLGTLFWKIVSFTNFIIWPFAFIGIVLISWLCEKLIILKIFNKFYAHKKN